MVDNLYEAAKQVVSAETVLGGLALEDYWEMIPGRFPGMGAYGQSGFFAEKWTNSSIMIPQIKEYARKKNYPIFVCTNDPDANSVSNRDVILYLGLYVF